MIQLVTSFGTEPARMLNLDSRDYAHVSVHQAERDRIFKRCWQLLGPAQSVAAAGAYLAADIAGWNILVIRGDDGMLRGFHNVCRHRGSKLVEPGTGSCATLSCPYHGWRYDLAGHLQSTPWYGEATPFDLSAWPLRPIAVKEWRGLLFAAIEPATGFEEQTGDFAAEIDAVPIESYSTVMSRQFSAPVNWKTYLDQFLEVYHVPTVHAPDKSVAMNAYTVEPRNQIMRMAAPAGTYYGAIWLWVWPNWTLSLFPGGMKTSRVDPIDAGHCTVHFDYFFTDGSSDAARQKVIDATASIFKEDIAACIRAQANYASGAYTPGPLHPRHERAVAYFHEKVKSALEGYEGEAK